MFSKQVALVCVNIFILFPTVSCAALKTCTLPVHVLVSLPGKTICFYIVNGCMYLLNCINTCTSQMYTANNTLSTHLQKEIPM